MPIIGKVNAKQYEYCLENMKVGDSGFINCDYIIVTKLAVFIDVLSPVFMDEDYDDDELDDDFKSGIPIKRIGAGLTKHDFEIDLSGSDQFSLAIEPMSIYFQLMNDSERYIIFSEFEIGANNPGGENTQKSELEILEGQLEEAKEAQDFIKAKQINEKITTLKLKLKEKKKE
jgi:hypothetical protein